MLTNQQLEIANLLNTQEGGVSSEVIDEIMERVGKIDAVEAEIIQEDTETNIRLKLMDETDWRKKAALSALLISNSLK